MSNDPRIDVILPNLNKADYVSECLDSLLAQSHSNWRCIVVDGDSDDGSWEIIRTYAQDDDRFELHRPGRLGLYPSWNYGLEQVESPYFTFLTSDDIWGPAWLEGALKLMGHDASPVGVCARPVYVDESSDPVEDPWLAGRAEKIARSYVPTTTIRGTDVQPRPGPLQAALVYTLGSVPITMHSVVMDSSLADMRFAEDVGSIADREWYLRMGLQGDVWYVPSHEVYLRKYEGQATAVTQRNRRQLARWARTILDRNGEPVREALQVPSEAFSHVDAVVRRMFDFLYMRPSLTMLRADPVRSISLLLRCAATYPRLLLYEIASVLLRGTKYSSDCRIAAFSELMDHAQVSFSSTETDLLFTTR